MSKQAFVRCAYHEYAPAVATCSVCGVEICERCNKAARDEPAVCFECQAVREARRKRLMSYAAVVTLAGAALLLGPLGLGLFGSASAPPTASPEDMLADECIAVLDDIGLMLEAGDLPPTDLSCPEGAEPYRVVREGELITVEDPNAPMHGYRRMYVTNEDPNPVLED